MADVATAGSGVGKTNLGVEIGTLSTMISKVALWAWLISITIKIHLATVIMDNLASL
jgi:hypothetical protein